MASTKRFIIVQRKMDQSLESKYTVFIRTCKVVDRETKETVMENLHYLDAWELAKGMNEGKDMSGWKPAMGESGHANSAELCRILRKW